MPAKAYSELLTSKGKVKYLIFGHRAARIYYALKIISAVMNKDKFSRLFSPDFSKHSSGESFLYPGTPAAFQYFHDGGLVRSPANERVFLVC